MTIDLKNIDKDAVVIQIQRWFEQELDSEIGQFDALFLLDFFADKIGPHFYNQGLADAKAILAHSVENIAEKIDELEKYPG